MTRTTAARSDSPGAAAPDAGDVPSCTQRVEGPVPSAAFESAVERFVRAPREDEALLLRIELVGFRSVEDRWGLRRSDELRESLIRRALGAVGPLALLGRLGTDELAVLVPPAPRESLDAQLVCLRSALDERDDDEAKEVVAHVGAVRLGRESLDPAELRLHARMALQRASGSRTGRTAFYDAALHAELDARAELLAEIRQGAEAGELTLHYQPICDLEGRAHGFEALMRWQHPKRGLLAPCHFLDAFEHPALSVLLGDVALRTALAQMRTWRDAGLDFRYVAVNVATEQIGTGDLVERIRGLLREYDIAPSSLMLEVTETVSLDRDAGRIVATLRSLRELGVGVALDDFGTGYASLSHLKMLPVDRLKIERAFVQGLKKNTVESAIVRALLLLGESLGIEVVAEGVETEAELAVLRASGCERIQGFLFSKPLPPAEAALFMLRSE